MLEMKYFKDRNQGLQMLSYGATCEISVVVIKNENALFTCHGALLLHTKVTLSK